MRNGKGKHDSEYPCSIQETYKIKTPTPLKGLGYLDIYGNKWKARISNHQTSKFILI